MTRNHLRALLLGASALASGLAAAAKAQDMPGGPAVAPNMMPDAAPADATPADTAQPGGIVSGHRLVILPYVEIDQILDVPISGGGDTLTYTDVAAGVDASVATQRVQATLNYRYERQFAESHDYNDQSQNTGVARAEVALVPNLVNLDLGALATRTRSGLGDATPDFLTRDYRDISKVYALYAGPSASKSFGALNVAAGYHFGYVHVDDGSPGDFELGPGQPDLQNYRSSTSQTVDASIGARPGTLLPFGWTVSGGYVRDDQHFLAARFEDKFVGLDVIQPVSASLALVGDVGYEKLTNSQRQLLVDNDGNAVLTEHGHLQGDKSLPRLLSYEQDGLFWDVGLSYRPDRRFSAEARVGRRYGEWIGFGSLNYQLSPTSSVQAGVYDQVETFGHQLTSGIGGLPTAFQVAYSPLVGSVGNCVFGVNGGQGGCLNGALQSVNGDLYRARGVYALYSGSMGPWTYGFGANYDERKYLTPADAIGSIFLYSRAKDRSATIEANAARTLSSISGIDGELYAEWYDSGYQAFGATPSVYGFGATAGYHRLITSHLVGRAAVGVYGTDSRAIDAAVSASALVGARYQF